MRLLSLAILTCATSLSCWGQAVELGGFGGVSRLSGRDLASGYSLDNGWRFGFRITLNSYTFFGHEFGYAYNRTKLILDGDDVGGMAFHQGLYNFLAYATPEGTRIRPFATGGAHFSNFVPPGASAAQGQGNNKFGVNYGGGIKARVTDRWAVRVDLRQYLTGKPFGDFLPVDGTLRQTEISVGLSFVL